MMRLLKEFGACDCHSHVYGPFAAFPLSQQRTLEPPEAPLEELESVWTNIGIDRAVLVQGSAYGQDHSALVAALQCAPKKLRGVALLHNTVGHAQLAEFHSKGIRAVRFNWVRHLLGSDSPTQEQRLAAASALCERIAPLGWHIEIHIGAVDLEMLDRLAVPVGMPVVIDHMARIDLSVPESEAQLTCLCELLENPIFWVKLSGADRLVERCDDLRVAASAMRAMLQAAPDRCVWGLDWPHVNLPKKRTDLALAELLFEAVEDDSMLRRVLIENPARLYDFGESTP
jgi:2-pyrone-4,6-dicarboxylate lactonase